MIYYSLIFIICYTNNRTVWKINETEIRCHCPLSNGVHRRKKKKRRRREDPRISVLLDSCFVFWFYLAYIWCNHEKYWNRTIYYVSKYTTPWNRKEIQSRLFSIIFLKNLKKNMRQTCRAHFWFHHPCIVYFILGPSTLFSFWELRI